MSACVCSLCNTDISLEQIGQLPCTCLLCKACVAKHCDTTLLSTTAGQRSLRASCPACEHLLTAGDLQQAFPGPQGSFAKWEEVD